MADKENQFQGVVESLLKGMDTVLSCRLWMSPLVSVPELAIIPRKNPHPEPEA